MILSELITSKFGLFADLIPLRKLDNLNSVNKTPCSESTPKLGITAPTGYLSNPETILTCVSRETRINVHSMRAYVKV